MGGQLPSELYRLPQLDELVLSNANFEGILSEDFRFLNETIRQIVLNDNRFSGTLPEAFDH